MFEYSFKQKWGIKKENEREGGREKIIIYEICIKHKTMMEISLFGVKFNLEILILIGILYWITVSHTLCSCCNPTGIMEAFTSAINKNTPSSTKKMVSPMGKKEGFVGANTNYGQSAPYTLGKNTPVDTSSWGQQSLVVTPGQPIPPAVQQILDRPSQPVPLPEGEMLIFANTPFKPECRSAFSNSSGNACLTTEQYNYLGPLRGGNNVPYSEY